MSGSDARSRPSKLRLLAALALVATIAVAGCGGDDEESGGGGNAASGGEPTTLKVGVLPIGDLAPLYLGMDQGFFEAEKLTIEPAVAEGGAAVVPAVMSGDNQIGFSNVTSLMIGKAQNLPLKPIAAGVSGAASEDEAWDALLSPKGGVTDLKQLEGKKVSVNTLKNLPEVAVRNSLEKAGVDSSKVRVRRDPVPGRPGGARGQARGRGVRGRAVRRRLGGGRRDRSSPTPFEELAPDLTIAEYFTTEKYAQENAGRRRALQARDEQVARLRPAEPGRGAPDHHDLHEDAAGGRRRR